MSFLVHSPLIPWHHLQENDTQTLWLVHDIQMLWHDWCEIHTLMRQSGSCEIRTLLRRKQHTTLHANSVNVSQSLFDETVMSVTQQLFAIKL